MRVRVAVACAITAVVCVAIAAPAAGGATDYPVPYNFGAGIAAELVSPGSSPPGSNDWTCRPSTAHPYPVVLAHGTFGDMTNSWQALSPLLANNGYCVFALDYGGSPGNPIQAYGPIETSAAQLSQFVDRVRSATHAPKVDIVGHSQGGMMPRYYMKFLGGAPKVHTLVGLAPSNHGTNLFGLVDLLRAFPSGSQFDNSLCEACSQQTAGSPFLTNLNAGGDTIAGVNYTVIETRYDEVVTPYTSAFLSGRKVTNITLQDQCPIDFADHLAVIYDSVALRDVLNALDPAHALAPQCVPVFPVLGG